MTVDLFQFSHRPFAATCNVANYVPFESIEGALDSVSGNVRRGAGTAVVIGPAGLGKTMFCQVLASRLAETHEIVMLATSSLCTRRALLQNVLFELGLPYRDRDEGELRLGLLDHLRSKHNNSQGMLMIVDEAQTMPLRLLEEVRVLSNISRDGRPRVHLVFTGNQSFEERLNHPKLDAIQQRISARSYLFPMNREETLRFVSRQWAQAAAGVRLPFTTEALQQIHDASEGIPRLVNQLCDHALMLASARGVGDIADSLVAEAWADLQQLPTPWQVNHQDTPLSLGKTPATVIEFGSLDASRPWGDEGPRAPSTESTAMARLDELEELTTDVLEVETAATETDSVVEFSSPAPAPITETKIVDPFADMTFDQEEWVTSHRTAHSLHVTVPESSATSVPANDMEIASDVSDNTSDFEASGNTPDDELETVGRNEEATGAFRPFEGTVDQEADEVERDDPQFVFQAEVSADPFGSQGFSEELDVDSSVESNTARTSRLVVEPRNEPPALDLAHQGEGPAAPRDPNAAHTLPPTETLGGASPDSPNHSSNHNNEATASARAPIGFGPRSNPSAETAALSTGHDAADSPAGSLESQGTLAVGDAQRDDRDLLHIEDPVPKGNFRIVSAPLSGLSGRAAEGPMGTAFREDYRSLFSRLRGDSRREA